MIQELKTASQRVQTYLASFHQDFVVRQIPDSTRTAKEAAEALNCSVAQIAKSLIFKDKASGEAILVVASGSNRVSPDKITAATGYQPTKANADFVREKTGYAIGGVPPVAHKNKVITLLDEDLLQYDLIWAAAGTPNSVFQLTPTDLDRLTQGQWLCVVED